MLKNGHILLDVLGCENKYATALNGTRRNHDFVIFSPKRLNKKAMHKEGMHYIKTNQFKPP